MFITWHSTIRKNYPFFLIYLFINLNQYGLGGVLILFIELQLITIIINFDDQIVPDFAIPSRWFLCLHYSLAHIIVWHNEVFWAPLVLSLFQSWNQIFHQGAFQAQLEFTYLESSGGPQRNNGHVYVIVTVIQLACVVLSSLRVFVF